MTEPITVHLPDALYDRLKHRADQMRRPIEVELVEAVATAIPESEDLPPELEEAISSLALLNDDELWRAARSQLPREAVEQLAELNLKQQSEGLSDEERSSQARLLRQYERLILVRAEAAGRLKERGHDVSVLLTKP